VKIPDTLVLRPARASPLEGVARSPLVLFLGLILYRVLLDASYERVADIFDYQGLFLNRQTLESLILSWVVFLGFMPYVVRLFRGTNFSDGVMILLVLFSLIPQTTVFCYRSDYPAPFVFLITVYWALLCMLHFWSRPIVFRVRPTELKAAIPYVILAILIPTVIAFSLVNTGLRLHWNLIDVYGIRAEAREFVAPFPINYVLSFADNALGFFAVLMLVKRRFLMLGVVLFAIFVNFSITGTKQIVFIVLCGLLGSVFIKNPGFSYRVLVAALGLAIACHIETALMGTFMLTGLFPYRVLFIPAELHHSYFSFFQANELDLYRQSILKFLFDSPYATNIQFLLGEYSIGDVSARANNGLFSDAYMNIGAVGALLYPLFVVVLLRLFDGAVSRLDGRMWFVLAIYMSFVLLGMTLSTALLTAGLLPFLLMLYMFSPVSGPRRWVTRAPREMVSQRYVGK